MSFVKMTAEEAASFINHDDNVGFSGFTAAGSPKVISLAIAAKAEAEHEAGRPFQIGMYTGASTNDQVDGALARAKAIKFRTPYQSTKDSRIAINKQEAPYADMHLSTLAPSLRYGVLGKIDTAIIEAADVTPDGKIILGIGVGIAPTVCQLADKILIELNSSIPKEFEGFHDIYQPLDPPHRQAIPIYSPSDRIGVPYVQVDPAKIVGIVDTCGSEQLGGFTTVDEVTMQIGTNVADFLAGELKAGRLPKEFLPLQSGVGNIANAVLSCLEVNPDIPRFSMYTEVVQDSVLGLMKSGKCKFASSCSLTISPESLADFFSNLDFFRDKVVLRPSEISNNPALVRRLGIISINTAIEVDIYGNVNSTNVTGTKMMNGIGGSGDFTRNAYVSIFTTPSIAKGGDISAIVPMVSHHDHSEHSVDIIITEQGVADLRGKSPSQRAQTIIENCVHPMYKGLLYDYLKICAKGHTPHNLAACFAFHREFLKSGKMQQVDWADYTM